MAEFYAPETVTAASVAENLEAWWEYAGEDHNDPTVEDRLSALEDVVSLLIE